MKLSGYDEENTLLTDRALWWKNYQDYDIEEIRQIRGRMNAGMKNSVIQGIWNQLCTYFIVLLH